MRRLILAVTFFACVAVGAAVPTQGGETASPDDTARFLAGMQPAAGSPLAALTSEPSWQQHAKLLDGEWAGLDKRQLSNIRAWSTKNLTAPRQVLFYMFSGPDFLYANAFFPAAGTYVLSGLEPVGGIPDVTQLPRGSLSSVLRHIETSLSKVLSLSYFITMDMDKQLRQSRLDGTLPILYVFLARSGQTIHAVNYVNLDPDGTVKPVTDAGRAHAVKIDFSGSDGRAQTLYFFNTNLSNKGVSSSGFLQFCAQLGTGDSFVKSASYLLHGDDFSNVRGFLLDHSAAILQDDTGIPASYFKPDQWQLQPFGTYTGPIGMFRRNYQSKLRGIFHEGHPIPIDFGIGYKWRVNQSNLLLAVKKDTKAAVDP